MFADTPAPFLNVFSISPLTKTVPYQGSELPRADGGTDHGFKNLKLHPELLEAIPELESDPALRKLTAAIDRPETGLFTTACESRTIADERGSRLNGYFEFALNCRVGVADPGRYFGIFHEFARRLQHERFDDTVSFQWVLCPTRFAEASLDGFAAEVRVDTCYHSSHPAAYACWSRALAMLEATLAAVPRSSGQPIY